MIFILQPMVSLKRAAKPVEVPLKPCNVRKMRVRKWSSPLPSVCFPDIPCQPSEESSVSLQMWTRQRSYKGWRAVF